jgi:hypothetical protein
MIDATPEGAAAVPQHSQRSRWWRFGLYFVAVVVVFYLFAALALPSILRPWLETQASQALQRQVSIGGLAINPLLLKVSLRDVAVQDKFGPFVEFKELTLDVEASSMVHLAPVLREITLDQARIKIVRLAGQDYNFSDLIKSNNANSANAKAANANAANADAGWPRFSLNNIRLRNSEIKLDDRVTGQTQVLDQLNFALPFVSTFPHQVDDYIQPAFSGRLNGRSFALQGKTKPFAGSLDTALSLKLDSQDVTKILAYVPLPAGLAVPQAHLAADLELAFHRQAKEADILLNGHVIVSDAALTAHGAPLLGLKRLDLALKNMKPLARELKFGVIALDGLDLTVVREADGQINWQKIDTGPSSTSPPLVEVAEIQLRDGTLHWQDQHVAPAFGSTLQTIDLNIKNLSNQAASGFPLQLRANVASSGSSAAAGAGAPVTTLAAELTVVAKPLRVAGHLAASGLQAQQFAAYYRPFLQAGLAAKADLAADVAFSAEPLHYSVDKAQLAIDNLALTLPRQPKPALTIKQFQLSELTLDSDLHAVHIGKLESASGDVQVQLLKDGGINLMQALAPVKAQSKAHTRPPAKPDPAWRIQLAQGSLAGWKLQVRDARVANAAPFIWNNIGVQLKNVDTQAGASAQLALKASGARGAKLDMSGSMVPQPFSGKFKVDVQNIDAALGQPYFSEFVNISLARGFLHAKGELQLATQPRFAGSYKGSLRSTQFYALDKHTGADFLKWNSLALNGINTQFAPLKIDIADIALTDFYSRLILSADGRLNLQDVLVKNGEAVSVTTEHAVTNKTSVNAAVVPAPPVAATPGAAASLASPASPISIKIGKITLSGGNIAYSDLFIKPNFTANLTGMGGVIGGISSQNDSRATLDLRGSVDQIAPVEIKGSLNPLAQDFFIDISGGVKGYELTNASAYAIKYAGYGIKKGKLSMDVAYLVEHKKLKASNQLFLDQLTLGDAVDSPTATKLPVRFALALLTDRKGQIKLNLPIDGSLDDPQFSVGGIIWQVIGNVFDKIISAPFAALGGIFGSGPSLSRVEYAPGRAALDDAAKGALHNLAQALADHPQLQLEISGWASLEADADGLRQQMLRNKMRAIKAAALGEKAESIESESAVALRAEEMPDLIKQVYQKEKFPKPKNLIGLAKALPTDEMKKLLLANMMVGNLQASCRLSVAFMPLS